MRVVVMLVVVMLAVTLVAACQTARGPEPISTIQPARPIAAKPDDGRVVYTESAVEILDPIKFLSGSAAIHPSSTKILDAIAETLTGNPSIKLVAVHAYGGDALRQFQARVGAERAQAIVDHLVARGVQRNRLLAEGRAAPPPGASPIPSFEILQRDP